MAYCNANTDVGALTGITYSTSTVPTLLETNVIIDQISAEIEVILAVVGISNPSSNATFLTMLKRPCSLGSAGLVLMRYGVSDGDYRRSDWMYGKYEAWLEKVTTNKDYQKTFLSFFTTNYVGVYVTNNIVDGTISEAKYIDEKFFK